MGRRTLWVGGGTVAAVAVVAGGTALALTAGDESADGIGTVTLQNVSSEQVGTAGAGSSGGQQVAGLDELTGTVEQERDGDLVVGGVELDFGPDEWVRTAGEVEDLDGDGTVEDLETELAGLVGTQVTLQVRLDDDGDDADVYVVNGTTYRDTAGGPAPWETAADDASGTAASQEQVSAAAVEAVGAGARATDVDRETGAGEVAWEVEVVDADGREHTVLLDATGTVLDTRPDDD